MKLITKEESKEKLNTIIQEIRKVEITPEQFPIHFSPDEVEKYTFEQLKEMYINSLLKDFDEFPYAVVEDAEHYLEWISASYESYNDADTEWEIFFCK